ncbi:ShlB/FhaC/HecB family hemolysin secretion/activation protein [Bordetella hinzii]|uniref:ShlB/FhaC/HecB family hemolysin secretion/activation protein n=1 Tax=Bordetella hinzii TaxID=103855 RepID=UPI0005186F9F|nr:ShlB/FhaC/HecB family hemolysin secretion/activation protein [Bordetella hinzii]MCJ9708045.1 ShlB/FhaC/HecB family hemolysin secretion/activation protein [Bordetella hinzii]QDJ33191.1 ShlB/FhaC/HecB family hemolysin secretion/activation protein [Bordetella hinzii]QDJ51267.1 ShlB/FhaC/HecB family hemolysin secretion/activation protein [Bordetella hinzii]QII86412.1 ShlB/FhaC/HecB family hemolysin secretion/activation protein [Bordetella hinzii]QWF37745.1 ShlB/FhaC/HecB family hemolysin secret
MKHPVLRSLLVSLSLALGIPPVWADGPLRGNPVDALPQIERPPAAAPPTPVAPTPEQQAVAARLAQHIVPRHFDVSGVKTIPFEEVSAFLTPLAGKDITVAQLVAEVDKITVLYRERGYPLSFALVQNQDFANGLVVVTVVEGYIENVRIDGDIGNARQRLESLAQPLLQEKPLKQATLERVLNLMRTVPGVSFTPALELPKRANGATELSLEATRKKFTGNGGIADMGTGMQPIVNVGANSLTPLGEQVRLTASIPLNTDDVKYFAGEVRVPVGNDGWSVKVDGYHYQARPQDDAVQYLGFDRKVTTDRIGVGVSYPILLNNRRSLTGTLGMYATNSQDRYDQRHTDNWLREDSRVRAATAELRYLDVLPERSTDATLSVSKGFDSMGARAKVTSNYGYEATPPTDLDFTRWNLSVRQAFTLPAQFGLVLSGAGQYSSDILPTSEQVSFGSWRYGMGYPQGEISGDKGLGLSAEINRRFNIGYQYLRALQPYVMVDYARSWYNNPALKPVNPKHLSSVALGFRITDDKYYLFDFNIAKPVGAATVNDRDRDVRFNANYSLFYDAF